MQGVEADEIYIGGLEKNKHSNKKLRAGRGAVDKTAVAEIRDRETGEIRAQVVERTDGETPRGFVEGSTAETVVVFTDEASAYCGVDREHRTVNHGAGLYVGKEGESINSLESIWVEVKRANVVTFRKMSPKHTQRYLDEFTRRLNTCELDMLDQMAVIAMGLVGKSLTRDLLISDIGLSNHARRPKCQNQRFSSLDDFYIPARTAGRPRHSHSIRFGIDRRASARSAPHQARIQASRKSALAEFNKLRLAESPFRLRKLNFGHSAV